MSGRISAETGEEPPKKRQLEAEQVAEPSLQQPKPKSPRLAHASFLENFVALDCPDRTGFAHIFILNWLDSVGSNREKQNRSDSYLHRRNDDDGDPISRRCTRSAPEVDNNRDSECFVTPLVSASDSDAQSEAGMLDGLGASPRTGSTRSHVSLVENPTYREVNLSANHIFLRPLYDPLPEHISPIVDHIRRDRFFPGASPDQGRLDAELNELWVGTAEPDVDDYFRRHLIPKPGPVDALRRTDRQPMAKHTVPNTASCSLKVSIPVPDMVFGYNRHLAFPQHQARLNFMGAEVIANNQNLLFPFFIIEFKGVGGSMWAATNQCLGGSASCVNVAERLNRHLEECNIDNIQPFNSAAFSLATNGTEARLHITWRENSFDYYMAHVQSFLLQEPRQYLELRKYIRNIIDWGKDRRLREIRDCLDILGFVEGEDSVPAL